MANRLEPIALQTEVSMLSSPDKSLLSEPDLTQFWDLETIGIKESPHDSDDGKALEHFERTVQFVNGRYVVSLPWKNG